MVLRGASSRRGRTPAVAAGRPRRALWLVALVATLVAVSALVVTGRATGADPGRCEQFAAEGAARAEAVSGSGADLVVIGDSWTAGLGLEDATRSWPSRLPGRVHAVGFSGSGFSALASGCGRQVSFAARAAAAVAGLPAGTPVVVAGGLNDWDRPDAEISAGFERLLARLDAHPLTVVGPAAAPSRSAYVPRVEGLLARLCAEHGVRFVPVSDLRLDYLPDQLHLTPAGHARFGDEVAARLSTAG